MIRAVVFDMDGVLFDTERLCLKLWKQVSAKMGTVDVTEYAAHYMGTNSVQHRKYFADQLGADFPYDEYMRQCREAEFEEIARSGVPVNPVFMKF